jgi:hypothetical protein
MIRKILAPIALAGFVGAGLTAGSSVALYPECGPVTYTWGTKYPTCDLDPPDVLHVLGISYTTCLNWGGVWGGYITLKDGRRTTICRYVDY